MRNMQEKLTVFFLVAMVTCSRSPSENGSVISNESGKPDSGRGSPQKVMAQQKVTKEEGRKRNGEKCFMMRNLLYTCHFSHRDRILQKMQYCKPLLLLLLFLKALCLIVICAPALPFVSLSSFTLLLVCKVVPLSLK